MPYTCANRVASQEPITYWAPLGTDGFGQPTLAAPVLTSGYWQEVDEMVRNAMGDSFNSHHIVYLLEYVLE